MYYVCNSNCDLSQWLFFRFFFLGNSFISYKFISNWMVTDFTHENVQHQSPKWVEVHSCFSHRKINLVFKFSVCLFSQIKWFEIRSIHVDMCSSRMSTNISDKFYSSLLKNPYFNISIEYYNTFFYNSKIQLHHWNTVREWEICFVTVCKVKLNYFNNNLICDTLSFALKPFKRKNNQRIYSLDHWYLFILQDVCIWLLFF